jgi:hypothetical protein
VIRVAIDSVELKIYNVLTNYEILAKKWTFNVLESATHPSPQK